MTGVIYTFVQQYLDKQEVHIRPDRAGLESISHVEIFPDVLQTT